MEIQGTDGSKTRLKPNTTTIFGRGNGCNTTDSAVSRRHISFDLTNQTSPYNTDKVSFEVVGKNPVWIYSKNGDKKVKTFKRFQRGELGFDDLLCFSGKNPVWFSLNKVANEDNELERLDIGGKISDELSQSLEGIDGFDGNFDFVDVSHIDPVQEFGFLVIGHEFDQYPKKKIRDIKNWDWFLEDPRGDSDDEDTTDRSKKSGGRRKRKKSTGNDDVDEEWTAESEGEELTTNAPKVQRPKYHTRSKDDGSSSKKRTKPKTSAKTSSRQEEQDYEDEEDEVDETLGGFIFDDDTAEEEVENEIDEDEEEEFVEEDELDD